MRSPVVYIGSKARMTKVLLPLIPKHRCYVEVFGGGASLLFTKSPSPMEVYNDVDEGIVTFFRVLRDQRLLKKLMYKLKYTPLSRKVWYDCRGEWRQGNPVMFRDDEDVVDRAWRWYVVNRQSWNGHWATSWGHVVKSGSNVTTWLTSIDHLDQAAERLRTVAIEWKDFRWVLDRYDASDTVFYCDPPYVPETLKTGWKGYPNQMSVRDHKDLVTMLLDTRGMCILSGYDHRVYQPLRDAYWTQLRRKVTTGCAGSPIQSGLEGRMGRMTISSREEVIWLSPNLVERRREEDNAATTIYRA